MGEGRKERNRKRMTDKEGMAKRERERKDRKSEKERKNREWEKEKKEEIIREIKRLQSSLINMVRRNRREHTCLFSVFLCSRMRCFYMMTVSSRTALFFPFMMHSLNFCLYFQINSIHVHFMYPKYCFMKLKYCFMNFKYCFLNPKQCL